MEQDYNVWFGKRLKEVMEHKGATSSELSKSSGVGRMTISRIIQGRYATAAEVKKLAEGLEITVERLKQKDVELGPEKRSRRLPLTDPDEALREALQYVSVALGSTEMGLAYQVLGKVYYLIHDFGKALDAYQNSMHFLKNNSDMQLIFEAYHNLMHVLVILKDYDALTVLFQEAELIMQPHETYYNRMLQYKASIFVEHRKQYAEAYEIYLRLLELSECKDIQRYRRTLCNLGDVSFRMGQYQQSKQFYERVYDGDLEPESNEYLSLYVLKDFAKTLLVLGETERAYEIVRSNLESTYALHDPKLTSHYLLLHEFLIGDGTAAEKIRSLELEDEKTNMIASLLLYFSQKMDRQEQRLDVLGDFLSNYLILE